MTETLTIIISNILEFIPPSKLFEVSKINRQWRAAVKNFGVVRINFATCKNQKIRKLMETLHEQLSDLNCGHVKYILVDSFRPLPSSVFNRLQHLCPNVVFFDYSKQQSKISGNRHKFLDGIIQGNSGGIWKNLRHLPDFHRDTVKHWKSYYADQLFSLYARMEDFTTVNVVSKKMMVMTLPFMPWLNCIIIDVQKKIDERTINSLHEQCPSLTTLQIKNAQLNFQPNYDTNPKSPVVPTLKQLTLDRVIFSNFTCLLYFSLKYKNIQSLTLHMNKYCIPSASGHQKEKKKIRRHLYLLITSLKNLKSLTIYLDDWYATGSSVLTIWPGQEIHKWRSTGTGQYLQVFKIKYGDVNMKLCDLLK